MTMLRGILVYLMIAVFCVAVWAGVVTMILRYGWAGGAAIVAVLLTGYEVVFGDWPGADDFAEPDGVVLDESWNDEAAA